MAPIIQIEGDLAVDLDGEPCFRASADGDLLTVTFASTAAFRRAVRSLRHVPRPVPDLHRLVPPETSVSFRTVIKLGDDILAEIVPGEPPSLMARAMGLGVPGLQLRSLALVRSLLAGD